MYQLHPAMHHTEPENCSPDISSHSPVKVISKNQNLWRQSLTVQKNVRVANSFVRGPQRGSFVGEPTLRMSMRRLHLTKFDWRLELEHLNAIKTNPPVQEVGKKRFQPQAATSWWPHWSFWLAALSGSSWSCSQPPVGRWHISHNKIQGWTMPCEVWIYSEHKIHNTAHP